MQKQRKHPCNYSFEFFPAKTPQGIANLHLTAQQLSVYGPHYFSVTYGAGGSTQERTIETVKTIYTQTNISTAPHISCIASTREKLTTLLHTYRQHNISHLVALRGDIPSGLGTEIGELNCARDLVAFIREHSGDHFHIDVAAYPEFHPQAKCPNKALNYFREKILAGANSAITQYFYNPDAYFRFIDNCEKLNINVPIVPGIMPITNYANLVRFSDCCGAEIPRWLRMRLASLQNDKEGLLRFGEDIVTALCDKLLQGGAPGLHFYTLNKAKPSLTILANLGFKQTTHEVAKECA